MFNLRQIFFKDNKEQIVRPFLCDQIKQFGFCKGSCSERHMLCKTFDKKCIDIPMNCFISIQLITILSASHFYGRILKYSTVKDPTKDKDWISVDDSFEKIKDELKNAASSLDTKVLHKNPYIGEMVMIENKLGEFFRAIVLDKINGWLTIKVKVKLIDLGLKEEIDSNKVFIIPNHLKEFRPVAVEIIISSMEPVGEGEYSHFNWPISTTNLVRSLLQPIILADLQFICKVELIIGITLWVNWMLVKKCINCSHFTCKLYTSAALMLPRELIERNLAKINSQLIDKLRNLYKDTHVWKEYVCVDEYFVREKTNVALLSYEETNTKINEVTKVQWAHLSEDIITNISVNYVEHPKCFLVCNLKFSERISALQKDINETIINETVTHLTYATVGTVCLAISPIDKNQYNRAIIKEIYNETAIILYVDYGEFYNVKVEHLLTIPSNLITKLPFQVIECNLSGFNDILHDDIINQFNNLFLQLTGTQMYLKIICSSLDAKLTGGNCYEVVLFNNDININITMADKFKTYVNNTQIQNILNLNYKFDEHESEDDEYTEEEIESQFVLLQSLMNISKKIDKEQIMFNSTNSSQDLCTSVSTKTNDQQNVSNLLNLTQSITEDSKSNIKKEKTIIRNTFCLNCNVIPIVPQCFWHQDNQQIYLKLNILAVKNYNISCEMDAITINAETNSDSYFFTAVLYTYIIKDSLTHHISFDGIYIKAQKLVQVHYKWPRLLKCSKRHKYVIYDTEYIDVHKNWNVWYKIINKYKMIALGQPLSVVDYDSNDDNDDDSDLNCDKYTIFED